MFFAPISKTPILQKSLFSYRKIAIFQLSSLQKSLKKSMRKQYQKKHRKNASKIEFWPPCWPPKSFEIPPKSDAERSLFRDAMQLASKSPEINRPHSLLGVQMATHMIRSSPSMHSSIHPPILHPSIHPSTHTFIDLPLVALIIKVRSAT